MVGRPCFQQATSEELAQNARRIESATQRTGEFLRCLVARIGALYASKQQPGNALRDGLAKTAKLLSCNDQASLGGRAI
jgi:hypothetical protein